MHRFLRYNVSRAELARNRELEARGELKENQAKAVLRCTARSQGVTPAVARR